MSDSLHAFDFLKKPETDQQSIIVTFGGDRFLKRLVLRQLALHLGDVATDVTTFEEKDIQWRDVMDELATNSLFGGDERVVVVRDADDFVKIHRGQLEDFVSADRSRGVLILDVNSWPGNTRLSKLVAKTGLTIECRPPIRPRSKNKDPDVPKIVRWLNEWSQQQHGRVLSSGAAEQMIELAGTELGILDQELAKLALFVDSDEKVSPQLVRKVVGGWRQESTWELLDAALDGQAALAIGQLDRLLQAGEAPQALFGAITWSLRRFAAAVRVIEQHEKQGSRMNMKQALEMAGFNKWMPGGLDKAEKQLRQLGRQRGSVLYQKLLEADLSLKGTHSAPERARWAIEQLILWLSSNARPKIA